MPFLSLLLSCARSHAPKYTPVSLPAFDVQGHRGARGLMPENTIPAMRKAIAAGVTTLEMDCQVTQDGAVVLSHDAYLNPLIARTPAGQDIPETDKRRYRLLAMPYAAIREFEMGTKFYAAFPQQQRVKTYIPLLSEVIDSVQHYLQVTGKPQVFYNLETKSSPTTDNQLHPEPAAFVDYIMAIVQQKKIVPWVIIQSFDRRTLQELHQRYPQVKTALLVENTNSYSENLRKLGFRPTVYSPHYKLVTPQLIQDCHAQGIKIIPWTVNNAEEAARLRALGTDGVITDYPNLFKVSGK